MNSQSRWNAEDYARNSSAQWQWAQELIAKLDIQGNEVLLDIGCGDGKITAALAQKLTGGSVLGIDASAEMIAAASQRFTPDAYPNLSFQQMDATALNLPRQFDLVFSNATLHWIPNHQAVLKGVSACLKPGGQFLFQMGGQGNAEDVIATIGEIITSPTWAPYFKGFTPPYSFYSPQMYQRWLPEHGFRLQRAVLIPKDMQHDNPEGLKGWLRTTWFPYTDRLPVEERDRFLDEIVTSYIARFPLDAQGKTHVHMVRLEVQAQRLPL